MDTLNNDRKRTRVVSFNSIDEESMCDKKPFQPPKVFLHAKKPCVLDGFLHRAIFDIDDRLDDLLLEVFGGNNHKTITTTTPVVVEEKDACHMNFVLQSFLQSPVSRDQDEFFNMIDIMEAEKKGVVVVEEKEMVVESMTKNGHTHEDGKDQLIPLQEE